MKEKHKKTKTKTEKNKGDKGYGEKVRAKWFCCAFKLGFLQLKCKVSLIFKSNLELALSIILKEGELYESKHVAVECKYLKDWDLLSFLVCFSILVLKWRQVLPIELELQLEQIINLYTGQISNHQELGLYMKNNF